MILNIYLKLACLTLFVYVIVMCFNKIAEHAIDIIHLFDHAILKDQKSDNISDLSILNIIGILFAIVPFIGLPLIILLVIDYFTKK